MLGMVARIDGYDPVAGTAVTMRAASHDDERCCHLEGQTWWPAITRLPTLRYDLFDGGFGGSIQTPASALALATSSWPDLGRYMLADARLQLWTGELGSAWSSWTQRFDGRLTAQPAIADGRAEIAFAVDDRWLDAPLLGTYAGTGGSEGPAALKGQPKPLALGAPRYVPGVLVNPASSILQLSAAGAIEAVEVAMEKLARFGASFGDYASYAALDAAAIPAGRWATAKAIGMVRHGAPPTGQVSYLVKGDKAGPDGWARLPGEIIRRLALLSGGTGRIDDASLDNLDAARPWNLSHYVDQQTTARELIQRVAASVNAVAGVSWLGKLFVAPVEIGAATIELQADGSALPPVAAVTQAQISAPAWRLAIEAERTGKVHGYADIAFYAQLTDPVPYNAGSTYREGNLVTYQGSTWLYINPTPTSGNAPPTLPTTSNSYWRVLAQAGSDGAPGIDGNPGADGADGSDGDPGADGADGDPGLSIAATKPAIVISCSYDGTVKAGQLPVVSSLFLYAGPVDVHESATYSITTTDCSATVSNTAGTRGQVTFTAMSANAAHADVTASYGGASIVQTVTLSKVRDGDAAAAGVTGAWGQTLQVALAPGGGCYAEAQVKYGSTTGSGTLQVQLQWSLHSAASWTAFVTGAGEAYGPAEAVVAAAAGSFTNGGGTTTLYDVRAIASGTSGAILQDQSFIKARAS